ncbi:MAG: glycoside hydrolase family 31 protein, partial [Bacilli bacterium]
MYNLGNHFHLDQKKAISNPQNIVQGDKYRITILTDSLIRFEYNEQGLFVDKPTELVWFRDMPPVEFKLTQTKKTLQITTNYVHITYAKEKNFIGSKINPSANLKVELLKTKRLWYYQHPEVRNFGGPAFLMQNSKGQIQFKKALYSLDGFASIDDSVNNIIDEWGYIIPRENQEIDTYLFAYVRNFAKCLQDYYSITGYPALIPKYALGNWWTRNIPYKDKDILNLIDNFEKNDIPLSVIVLDKDWHVRMKNGILTKSGYTFNEQLFEDPPMFINYLHSKNIKIGLSLNPSEGFTPYDLYFDEASKYLTKDKQGNIPFNLMNPQFIDVYLKIYLHRLENINIDFFWIDYHNLKNNKQLFYLQHYQFLDMARNNNRPMLLSENALIAPHRYPIMYSGKTIVSWETLKQISLYNSSATNIGCSWCSHDIGGYHLGTEDNELYTRFVQLGVFSPIMKFGSDEGKFYKREPWRWGVKTCHIVKKYLQLRQKLIPYLYTEAFNYSKYGIPLIQPLYYKNPEVYDDDLFRHEYFFGSQLFIAPILIKKDYVMNRVIHKFYVPKGTWYDLKTGKKFSGDKKYVSFYKDQDYPVFAQEGAIIPLNQNYTTNDVNLPKQMEICIFPGQNNIYNLYEDDGITKDYQQGEFLITTINYLYQK